MKMRLIAPTSIYERPFARSRANPSWSVFNLGTSCSAYAQNFVVIRYGGHKPGKLRILREVFEPAKVSPGITGEFSAGKNCNKQNNVTRCGFVGAKMLQYTFVDRT